jgi:hypothetical protein
MALVLHRAQPPHPKSRERDFDLSPRRGMLWHRHAMNYPWRKFKKHIACLTSPWGEVEKCSTYFSGEGHA